MPGDGMEEIVAAALALDQTLLVHQDTALVPMDHPAQDTVQALLDSLSPLVVTSRRLNGL
jgi:hypothetical protein